ncbi:MAG: hypothetical protein MJY79_00900 [Bacteroidaceae bacterium]|nr:hypothetical protein [Bacteroidaceae bacterium]
MKKTFYIILISLLVSCVGENGTEVVNSIAATSVSEVSSFGATLKSSISGFSLSEISRGKFGFLYAYNVNVTAEDFSLYPFGDKSGIYELLGSKVESDGSIIGVLESLEPDTRIVCCAFFESREGEVFIGAVTSFTTLPFRPKLSLVEDSESLPAFYTHTVQVSSELTPSEKNVCSVGFVLSTEESKLQMSRFQLCQEKGAQGLYELKFQQLNPGKKYYYQAVVKNNKSNTLYFCDEIGSFETRTSDELAVDMGLSVLWAGYDLYAENNLEYGACFSWGSVAPATDFQLSHYKWYDSASQKYIDIGTNISGTGYDPASAVLGGKWRLPTKEEVLELTNNISSFSIRDCTTVISSVNNNTLSFPDNARFYHDPSMGISMNSNGIDIPFYWTGSGSKEDNSVASVWQSYMVWTGQAPKVFLDMPRQWSFPVRAVRDRD